MRCWKSIHTSVGPATSRRNGWPPRPRSSSRMSSPLVEKLYAVLPVALQNAACSIEGWRIARRRYTPEFHQLLAEYEARTAFSRERMQEFRDARVRAMVQHCAQTVPYYRRLFDEWRFGLD